VLGDQPATPVKGDWTSWRAYLAGPVAGSLIAVGIAYVLRGRGGGHSGVAAAQGTLGMDWRLGRGPEPRAQRSRGL